MRRDGGIVTLALVLTMMASTFTPVVANIDMVLTVPGVSRAYDNDPDNGEPWGATRFTSGDVVQGSIRVNQTDDLVDWYVMNVPAGNVVNASLFLVDYDPGDVGVYNIQLFLGRMHGPDLELVDVSWTTFRWDAVSYLSPVTEDYYIIVISNLTHDDQPNTLPTNYTLSASVSTPFLLPWDTAVWGTADVGNSSEPDAWVKVDPPPGDDEEMYGLIAVPTTADFDIYAYQTWPMEPDRLLLLNMSRTLDQYHQKYVFFGGSEGDVYLKIDGKWGSGTFGLVTRYWDWTIDNNNVMDRAKEVGHNDPIWATLDQGRDRFDWYSVYLGFGDEVPRVDFTIKEGRWDIYNVSFYNRAGNYVVGYYNTLDGGWPNEENPTTPTVTLKGLHAQGEGLHYVLVHAVDRWHAPDQEPFEPARCEYTIQFTLPNLPPERTGTIPEVVMDEDTVDESLLLSKYFKDPDGHGLTYSLGKQTTHLDVDVNVETGRVIIVPEADWHGREKVVFRAIDDGPGHKFVEASMYVRVEPVNDPPKLVPGRRICNLILNESEVRFTETLSTVFTDPDNDPGGLLSYRIELVTGDMTPEGAKVPLPFYNGTMDAFQVGPIDFMFGNATFKVTADDNNGTLAGETPSLTFVVTVVHTNHAPRRLPGVDETFEVRLTEGELNDTIWVHDLVEDNDTDYAGDALSYSLSGMMNVFASITDEGRLVFDSSATEFYPGQNYVEEITLSVEDLDGEVMEVLFIVTVTSLDGPPRFRSVVPSDAVVTVHEGQNMEFKVVVDDDDTLTSNLNFTWYINKIEQKGENCSFFKYVTDYRSADGYEKVLRVVVTDGQSEIGRTWTVRVTDVDRPPQGVSIEAPTNASVFKKGKTINFVGKGSDPDGGELTFIWYDGSIEIGRGSSFSIKALKPGFHIIRLVVTDGLNPVETSVVFEIKREKADEEAVPGFEATIMAGAVVLAVIMVSRRRWWP